MSSSGAITGKPFPRRLQALIGGHIGADSGRLLVGPGPGLDAAVIDMGNGRVMAVAEDPIFPAPGLPLDIMGWFTVHIGASDVAVTGVRPQFMTYTLLLPRSSPESDARTIIESVSDTAKGLGISIVGGHTGWYDAVVVPIVGGVAVWGFADQGGWISPGGARPGDVLLLTKGPAIEAAALLGVLYRNRLAARMDATMLDAVCARTTQITVVEDAAIAFAAGGVHAMHDATEGGVIGGIWEMSAASGLAVAADLDAIPVPDDIAALAGALDFDPWCAISEGTLLAAVAPEQADRVLAAWRQAGIAGYRAGMFGEPGVGVKATLGGATTVIDEPSHDPFWPLFFAGIAGGE